MKYFIFICLCVAFTWATPSLVKSNTKVHPFRSSKPRIVNGQPAKLGQFPWEAAISFRGDFYWFCGGSIVSKDWIVTAGHCVNKATYAFVNTGLIDLNDAKAQARNATEFYLHEEYDGDVIANDIGLVKLETSLEIDEWTQPIPMAVDPLEADVRVIVSGWGLTGDDGSSTNLLQYVEVLTISNDKCEESYQGVFDEIICAVSESDPIKTPCSGDSGSPVVVDLDSNPTLVAVVSFVSNQGCEAGLPSGYTRIAYYQNWIADKTGEI